VIRPPVPVDEIAQNERITIARSSADASESGFLLRDGDVVIIGLNSRNTRRRQRFTIAHELGHWLLHEGRPIIVDHAVRINKRDQVSSAATDQEEIDANAFAAALLMPQEQVHASVQRELRMGVPSRDELTQKLANEFDVSHEAMSIRLINLGIYTA
jgi:Zn-dependent peptidase ImmA (M78 family)